jgi:hypothetical protein
MLQQAGLDGVLLVSSRTDHATHKFSEGFSRSRRALFEVTRHERRQIHHHAMIRLGLVGLLRAKIGE